MLVYCSKKHQNQPSNRFCTQCGELLPLPAGQVLVNRYRIVRSLGQGGFGRTYLAEDINNSNQTCVLKEFAPQVEQQQQLEKAKELFQREATVLQQLHHQQIPGFRETLQVKLGIQYYLFMVLDYVEGDTCWQLLEARKSQGRTFTEEEVQKLLQQILPVLSYIHSHNVIHRDISPDNIILRSSDNQPVLIDFGGVKQLAATQFFWFSQGGLLRTLLGKDGYAPEEQLRQGKVFANSDLYGLAVTALVLLTGKEPQQLYDSYQGVWRWGREINVSATLEAVLKKMLAYKPSDRYQGADEVLQALQSPPIVPVYRQMPNANVSNLRTMVAAPKWRRPNASKLAQSNNPAISQPFTFPAWVHPLAISVAGTSLVVLIGTGTWALVSSVIRAIPSIPVVQAPKLPELPEVSGEAVRINKILNRRQALEIQEGFFNLTVNELFYTENPEAQGRNLTSNAEDEPLRTQWYSTAEEFINTLDRAKLSADARQRLGTYSQRDFDNWTRKAQAGELGDYTIEQLTKDTDKKFKQLFAEQSSGNLNQKTFGQIWYAIAADKVSQLEAK